MAIKTAGQQLLEYITKFTPLSTVRDLTGIPLSTLYRYKSGLTVPSLDRFKSIQKVYGRINYFLMREAGATRETAHRFKYDREDRVQHVIDTMRDITNRIADTYGIEEDEVRRGLWMSDKTLEELEMVY